MLQLSFILFSPVRLRLAIIISCGVPNLDPLGGSCCLIVFGIRTRKRLTVELPLQQNIKVFVCDRRRIIYHDSVNLLFLPESIDNLLDVLLLTL
jgi:hypothetical protein